MTGRDPKSVNTLGAQPRVSRRDLLLGIGVGSTLGITGASAAIPRSAVRRWDMATDVLVSGSGAGGACAALAAKAAGAEVLLLEALPQLGGASAKSRGVIYAGGGTSLQRALGIVDSVESMYEFLVAYPGTKPDLLKTQRYCEHSASHIDWLIDQGVRYSQKLWLGRGLPEGGESLYFSGDERALALGRVEAAVPRGHVPEQSDTVGGASMMGALTERLAPVGVIVRTGIRGSRLVREQDGRIAGMMVITDDQELAVRSRRGVVLACGGFSRNPQMLGLHAPVVASCSEPWGSEADLGQGIAMAIGAGAATLRMHEGCIETHIPITGQALTGLAVNRLGQRFVNEAAQPGILGNEIARQEGGAAWLITDDRSTLDLAQQDFPQVAEAQTMGNLAQQLGFPAGVLQATVAYYNRYAGRGEDPLHGKPAGYLRPLQGPPYRAWDLALSRARTPAYTLGGLHTNVDGQVLNGFGEEIPGLYAVGRTAAGLPSAPSFAEGLSLADASYFGRRAGQHIVKQQVAI